MGEASQRQNGSASSSGPSLAEQLRAVESGLAFAPDWEASMLRLAGPDHREALERVVTQKVKDMVPAEGRLSLLLTSKGQFKALFAVLAAEAGLLLATPPGHDEEVLAGLRRYLGLSRCSAELIAWEGGSVAVLGPRWEEVAARLRADVTKARSGGWAESRLQGGALTWCGQTFLGVPGAFVWATSTPARAALDEVLANLGAARAGEDALELARVRAGFPAWGKELTGDTLPPEVPALDEAAVCYEKGCYIGQETMARMKTYGHPNWRLVRARQEAGPADAPALPLDLFPSDGDRPKARLTSWARHPEVGGLGLAMLHRTVEAGARLQAGEREYRLSELEG
jgi:folate-binding protein YgfZ